MAMRNVNKIKLPTKALWNLLLILLLTGGCAPAPHNGGVITTVVTPQVKNLPTDNPSGAIFTNLQVSFKLDPRLAGGTYGGEQWVSPSTYGPIVQAGNSYSVEARADSVDAKGNAVQITADWIPADSDMVTVSPTQGNQVTITIKRDGESRLQVIAGELSTTLFIKAVYKDNIIQVEISH